MKPILYGKQNITDEDIDAVVQVLKAEYLTQGPRILEFEMAFAEYVEAKYAVAVSNGTAALHLCTLALNVKQGSKVITSPITFVASANCIEYCGGEVVFGEIDPTNYTLDINYVRKLLEASPKETYSGIIPVDFAGRAVDLEKFRKLADEYNLWIIEDACHAINACRDNLMAGALSDTACYSMHPLKNLNVWGDAGIIVTNSDDLYRKLSLMRNHGLIDRNTCEIFGFNSRLDTIHAIVGCHLLKKIDHITNSRINNANYFDKELSKKQ